jgi:hypothetical protein
MTAMTASHESVLFVFRPGKALGLRICGGVYPFALHVIDELPRIWPLSAALLLTAPYEEDLLACLAFSLPVLVSGPLTEMERAFNLGAADFLSSPLIVEELRVRAGRILNIRAPRRFAGMKLAGLVLQSGKGQVMLNPQEAGLLNLLLSCPGKGVSRAALRDLLWPDLDAASRMIDLSVARLRKRFRELGKSENIIHTLRGFGYMVQNDT